MMKGVKIVVLLLLSVLFLSCRKEEGGKDLDAALGSHISANLRNASGQETLGMSGKHAGAIIFSTTQLSNAVNVISAYSSMINNVAGFPALQQSQNIELGNRIGDVINQTALGKTDRVKPIE